MGAPVNADVHPAAAAQQRARWLKAILPWHWVSSALTLAGLLAFAVTGITLNHAGAIESRAEVRLGTAQLSPEQQALLRRHAPPGDAARAPLPEALRAALRAHGVVEGTASALAEWSADEVYLPMPRPGGDAWLRIDRATGELEWEDADRGVVAWLNDLHKARHTGVVWSWFIDLFAVACVMASVTGLLLLALHARRRPSTWPLVAAGLALPAALALFAVH